MTGLPPMPGRPRIALIHATTAAIAPAVDGLAAAFPEAEPWNLLDDRLLPDADSAGGLTPELAQRMSRLIGFAHEQGAAGVLLTCSMYGPAATAADLDIPVLAPDEAAFARVIRERWRSVLVIASFATAAKDAAERLRSALADAGVDTRVRVVTADAALRPSREGDVDALTQALVSAVENSAAENGGAEGAVGNAVDNARGGATDPAVDDARGGTTALAANSAPGGVPGGATARAVDGADQSPVGDVTDGGAEPPIIHTGGGFDAIVLAQYSLAPAAERLELHLGIPVVAGPQSAAALLKTLLTERRD